MPKAYRDIAFAALFMVAAAGSRAGRHGGKIEFWRGGEKYMITRSSLIWVPQGLKHFPIEPDRIYRPIVLFTTAMTLIST